MQLLRNRLTFLYLIPALSFIGVFSILSPKVFATNLSFTELGTHPQAAAQRTATGRTINKLQIFNGKLYAGYGDWNANTGPIAINPFNLTTDQFEGSVISVPTEAIQNWKIIDGKLYASTVDPTCSGNCPAGYVVGDSDGNWSMHTPITAEHVLDIATLNGTDLWLFGAAGGATATAWRSTDGGDTWNAVQTMTNEPGGDNAERYYWGAALNGKMYMQSNYGWYNPPIQLFDGNSWTEVIPDPNESNQVCNTANIGGVNPVTFMGKIICKDSSDLRLFDGTTKTNLRNSPTNRYPNCNSSEGDLVTTSTKLYVLCRYWNGSGYDPAKLVSTNDLEDWRLLEGLPATAVSFAIDEDNNRVYVGTSDSKIYVSDLPEIDNTNPSVSITAPSPGASVKESLNITASASDNDEVSRVEFYFDGELIDTKTTAPYTTTWHNSYGEDGWETTPGQHTITAKAYDYEGNSATSSAVSITVVDPDDLTVMSFATGNSTLGTGILGLDDQENILFGDNGPNPFQDPTIKQFKKMDPITGSITSYDSPANILAYLGGSLFSNNKWWFADCDQNDKLKSVSFPDMQLVEYAVEGVCHDGATLFAKTLDGTVYHYGFGGVDHINKIATDGTVSQILLPAGSVWLSALNSTPDGQILMNIAVDNGDDTYSNTLARINQAGEIETYYSHVQDSAEDAISGASMTMDKDGNTWVGTLPDVENADNLPLLTKISPSGEVTRYDNPDGKVAFNLMAAPNGDIWYKTFDGLFAKLNPSTGVTTSYILLTPASEELFGNEAAGINAYLGYYTPYAVMDSTGNIWIGDSFGNRILKISASSTDNSEGGDNDSEDTTTDGSTTTKSTIKSSSSRVSVATTGEVKKPKDKKIILNDYISFLEGNGQQLTLKVGQKVHFFVKVNGKSEEHTATIKEIGKDYVIITFSSEPFDARLELGQTGKYDVDGDGNDDIQVTLDSVGNKQADITFKQLAITPSNIAVSKPDVPKFASSNNTKLYMIPFALFAIILLVIISKKKKRGDKSV